MNTYEWAQREIEIACENERKQCQKEPDYQEGNEDYGIMCYQAAGELLKIFEAQGHSGYSAQLVKQIFNRLVDGKPLTPVTDEEDQWTEYAQYLSADDGIRRYQHKRMSSLFKRVNADSKISINDIDRVKVYDKEIDAYFSTRFIDGLVNEIWPIAFPYRGEKIRVSIEEIVADDTPYSDLLYVAKAVKEDGTEILIDRYFVKDEDGGYAELNSYQYFAMKHNIEKTKEENKND